eukprot:TRINITY_DN15941_c0_g2_i1.p1 TRINITY_DN15941_c0_g2~~TRINITY_DN15941_c0_g2_i1.p1  ORF type:complete len:586 (-),score=109.91 TRINITY_DN15941_c0_g2_i1:175-1932(-)
MMAPHGNSDSAHQGSCVAGDWLRVEDVLSSADAADLRDRTRAELLAPEFPARAAALMAGGAPVECDAHALIVLGPSAAGKSYALRCFENLACVVPKGAMQVDGSFIRDASITWARTAATAEANGLAGFSDYFAEYFKPSMDKVKASILTDALARKANVVVPDTGSNLSSLVSLTDRFALAGYSVSFAAIYADQSVCEVRGKQRESKDGKKYSSRNWRTSVQAILDMHAHINSTGACQKDIQIFSNNGVLYRTSLQFIEDSLRRHGDNSAAECCSVSLQGESKTSRLAGVYRSQLDSMVYEVLPLKVVEHCILLRLTIVDNAEVVESQDFTCDDSSGMLRQSLVELKQELQPALDETAASAEVAKDQAKELAEAMKPTLKEAGETARTSFVSLASSAARTAVWFQSLGAHRDDSDSDEASPEAVDERVADAAALAQAAPAANTMAAVGSPAVSAGAIPKGSGKGQKGAGGYASAPMAEVATEPPLAADAPASSTPVTVGASLEGAAAVEPAATSEAVTRTTAPATSMASGSPAAPATSPGIAQPMLGVPTAASTETAGIAVAADAAASMPSQPSAEDGLSAPAPAT